MGIFGGGKKDDDPKVKRTKDVSVYKRGKRKMGELEEGKNRWVMYDDDGKVIRGKDGKPIVIDGEKNAEKTARKRIERDTAAQRGGGYPGQEQNPRAEGKGTSRGAQKRANKHQPGDILKAHLEEKRRKKGK